MPSKYMQVPQPSNENDSNDAVEKKLLNYSSKRQSMDCCNNLPERAWAPAMPPPIQWMAFPLPCHTTLAGSLGFHTSVDCNLTCNITMSALSISIT